MNDHIMNKRAATILGISKSILLQRYIMSQIINDKHIDFKFISDDLSDEESLIYKYYNDGYPLTNIEFLRGYKKRNSIKK